MVRLHGRPHMNEIIPSPHPMPAPGYGENLVKKVSPYKIGATVYFDQCEFMTPHGKKLTSVGGEVVKVWQHPSGVWFLDVKPDDGSVVYTISSLFIHEIIPPEKSKSRSKAMKALPVSV